MTQTELKDHFRDKLIPHYKLAIERCRGKEYKEAMGICREMYVSDGVCLTSNLQFNLRINVRSIGDPVYWFKSVFMATSTPEIIDLLQNQVDKMESIVKS